MNHFSKVQNAIFIQLYYVDTMWFLACCKSKVRSTYDQSRSRLYKIYK